MVNTKESEFVKNARNRSAQHSVSTANNSYASPATAGYTRREHVRNINDRMPTFRQNTFGQVTIKARLPVLVVMAAVVTNIHMEGVSHQGKTPTIPTISTTIALVRTKKVISPTKSTTRPTTRDKLTTQREITEVAR